MPIMNIIRLLLILFGSFIAFGVMAQSNAASLLDEEGTKKVRSAQEQINKGKDIVDQMDNVQKEINAIYNSGKKINHGKVKSKQKEKAKLKMQSAEYFKVGYDQIIDVYDAYLKNIENDGNSELASLRENANT